MKIRELMNESEIEFCVDMYRALSDEDFMPSNRKKAIESLTSYKNTGIFIRVLEDKNEIVAWICAGRVRLGHVDHVIFQQTYYCSQLTGLKAVKAVKLLHEAMYLEAKRLRIKRVVSLGSHLDEHHTFARILEKSGWLRRGYLATKVVV